MKHHPFGKRASVFAASIAMATFSDCSHAFQFNVDDTKVEIGGFLKMDAMYDTGDIKSGSKGAGNLMLFSNVGTHDSNNVGNQTTMHANESRLFVKTSSPVAGSELTTLLEGDFWGGSYRMRQAYGSWQGISAGQMWTNFNSFVGSTPTLDFTGPVGRAGVIRQPLVSYTTGPFTIALESPNTDGSSANTNYSYISAISTAGVVTYDTSRRNSLPDLTMRYESRAHGVNYSVGALGRQVAYDSGTSSDTADGYGVYGAFNFQVVPGTTLRFHTTYGNGIGTYMGNNPAPAAYLSDGQLTTIPAWGVAAGLSQKLNKASINFALSHSHADWSDATHAGLLTSTLDKDRNLMHVNYIWEPASRVKYGLEFAWMNKETVAGDKGNLYRIHASWIYSF